MSLTYYPAKGTFVLRPDGSSDMARLARDTGLDWSTTARAWFTRSSYAALPFYAQADDTAQAELTALWEEYQRSWRREGQGHVETPPGTELRPFQVAGIEYARDHKNCLIGDQPGLGKTVQAIGVANDMGARSVLVVCPASVRLQWRRHIAAWSTIPRVHVNTILKRADGVHPRAHYVVVSYDIARNEAIHRALCARRWDLLVLDEAHYLKTPEAQRTRAVFGGGEGDFGERCLAERAERIVGLTGTPLPNRPRECYTLVRGLCWDAVDWQSRDAFEHLYNPSYRMPSGRTLEERGRLPELRARLRCNLMVRRMKRDVLPQLPDTQYELAYVEESGAIKKVLRAENLLGVDPLHLENADAEIMGQISTVRREMGEAKVPRVVEHVSMLLDGGVDKLVVFAYHREVIRRLKEALDRHGCVVVDGSTTPARREQRKSRFVRDEDVRVFLGQLESAGTGLDGLQEVAGHCVFAEASWVPKDNEQAVDRLHRMGQAGSVVAQFLVAPGSMDERVLGTAIEKSGVIHETLDAG